MPACEGEPEQVGLGRGVLTSINVVPHEEVVLHTMHEKQNDQTADMRERRTNCEHAARHGRVFETRLAAHRVRAVSSDPKEFQEIIKLPVNVTACEQRASRKTQWCFTVTVYLTQKIIA